MVDLIVQAGSALTIDGAFAVAPRYGVFRMETGSWINASVDLVIKADRAEFGDGCTIDARGAMGVSGPNGPVGGPGGTGTPGGKGRRVTIQAALARVGTLAILANGGAGGPGGRGGDGLFGGDGGHGGAGGPGGGGGQISLTWTRAAPGLPNTAGQAPTGHVYSSAGGQGGIGGPGGTPRPVGQPGQPGPMGPTGMSLTPQVAWRANVNSLLWAQAQDIGPSPRTGHAMVFDPARGKLVLFGGLVGGKTAGDTWEWDGKLWTQVQDTGPPARAFHGMAYDPAGQRVLVFGGAAKVVDDRAYLGDTWGWDGQLWVQLADTGPSARQAPAMATDPRRGRVVLFSGGEIGAQDANQGLADTWEWDGAAWTQVADTGPPARLDAKMAWDAGAETLVLFGGAGGGVLRDTWGWDGAVWKQLADTGPSARFGHAMASVDSAVLLFGGLAADAATRMNDTWAWRSGAWMQTQDMGPPPRSDHAMACASAAGDITLFGGDGSQIFQDTWRLVERV
ncbi:MAG TPA: kelch repeat-containing protein [Caulobacteraceae bacterium]|nr:kelch repeat-containing protein [Caulobacteraceae bacterium]